MKNILKTVGLESKEVFRASELKNRLKNSRYLDASTDDEPIELVGVKVEDIKPGLRVYVKSLGVYAKILRLKKNNKEAEIITPENKKVKGA